MKLSREIEKACGAPRNSILAAVVRLRGLHYDNLAILHVAKEAQAYAIHHGGSFHVAFNLYVSALTVKPRPKAPAPTGADATPPVQPGHNADPATDQSAQVDGEPAGAPCSAPSLPDQCPVNSKK